MSVIDATLRYSQCRPVLTHDEILAELKAQAAAKRFKLKDLAAHLSIAPARVNEMLSGVRRIQQREMPLLADWLGMNGQPDIHILEGAIPVTSIPLLGDVPAGNWREAVRNSHHFIPAPEPGMPKAAYALRVTGDSMDKIVRDGATIIIDPTDLDLFNESLFVVRNGDGETTFKQYLDGPARLVPCSNNPEHKVMPLGSEEVTVLGRVILITMRPNQAALD